MNDTVKRALRASRESKRIEFKRGFNTTAAGEWCELIKDIVAIANSGGGIIIFGLDSTGAPTGEPIDQIANQDPADITNKLLKYIGSPNFEVETFELRKGKNRLYALSVSGASIPHIFENPGTYDIGGGKQKSAFAVGTVYFRHGAKSEPGNAEDIRLSIDRALSVIRKSWIKGVRQVVQAPQGAEVVIAAPAIAKSVRAVEDPSATPVLLTRDSSKAMGVVYYEEIAEGIFEEINNVIDANKALAKGQKKFLLGHPLYYRIYAERQHVLPERQTHELLLRTALVDFYAPGLFWMAIVPDDSIAAVLLEIYRQPRNPQIHSLLRLAAIFGDDFSQWLLERMSSKWGKYAQPPTFYWTYKNIVQDLRSTDYRLRSSRLSTKSRIVLPGVEVIEISDLMGDLPRASAIISKVCIQIFEGTASTEFRSAARNLDYLAYGPLIRERGKDISDALIRAVGDQQIGELVDTREA